MLEQLDLTDDERQALEGDHDAITALADKLVDVPTPAGPTPVQLGTTRNAGDVPGVTTAEAARIKQLEQQNRELRRANEGMAGSDGGRNDLRVGL